MHSDVVLCSGIAIAQLLLKQSVRFYAFRAPRLLAPRKRSNIKLRDPQTWEEILGTFKLCLASLFRSNLFGPPLWQTPLASLIGKLAWITTCATLLDKPLGQTFLATHWGQLLQQTSLANLFGKQLWKMPGPQGPAIREPFCTTVGHYESPGRFWRGYSGFAGSLWRNSGLPVVILGHLGYSGPFWVILSCSAPSWVSWVILGHSGQFWATLGHPVQF